MSPAVREALCAAHTRRDRAVEAVPLARAVLNAAVEAQHAAQRALAAVKEEERSAGATLAARIKAAVAAGGASAGVPDAGQAGQRRAAAESSLAMATAAVEGLAEELAQARREESDAHAEVRRVIAEVVLAEQVDELTTEGLAALQVLRRVSRTLLGIEKIGHRQGFNGLQPYAFSETQRELLRFDGDRQMVPSVRDRWIATWTDYRQALLSDPDAACPGDAIPLLVVNERAVPTISEGIDFDGGDRAA